MVEFSGYGNRDEDCARNARNIVRTKQDDERSRSERVRAEGPRRPEDKLDGPLSSLLGRDGPDTDGWM
jgi:hypothetical protein